jgi:hypothetical protein
MQPTNSAAKNECAANHRPKHTARNERGDWVAFRTNCFAIFLSRKINALGDVQAGRHWIVSMLG